VDTRTAREYILIMVTREGAMKRTERTKAHRFDMLSVGDRFRTPRAVGVCTKVSARRAEREGYGKDASFNLRPSDTVDVIYFDVEDDAATGDAALLAKIRGKRTINLPRVPDPMGYEALRPEIERINAEAAAKRFEAKTVPGPVNVVAVTADARPISGQFDSFEKAAVEVGRWAESAFHLHGRPLVTVVMARGSFVIKFDLDSDGTFPRTWQRVWTLDAEQGR
jgi:hypothetical protein